MGEPGIDAVQLLSKANEERRTQDRRRLDGMVSYATQDEECRVMMIQRYFEDGEAQSCGRCDVCEPKLRRRRRRRKGGNSGSERS